MEEGYWIDRRRAAMTMARNASTAEARLIHYEMAGRYSLKATHGLPFHAAATTAPERARETLQLFARPDPNGARGGKR
jgi:hypothetical protein